MIFNKERLIVALDFQDFISAKNMINLLGDEVVFYKIGLEMLMSGDYFKAIEFLKSQNKKIFVDLKMYDIPATVGKAIKNLNQYEVDLITIHVANQAMMEEASKNKGKSRILGVTVLTSLEEKDLPEMGFDKNISIENLVLKRAEAALKAGLDGVVASSLETKILRQNLGDNFLIITPGIRFAAAKDDQKRVADVNSALQNGSSYLVVGRPITQGNDPLAIAQKINKIIDETFRNFDASKNRI